MERNFEDVIKPYNEEIFSDDYKDLINNENTATIIEHEPSEWECHMFGLGDNMIFNPKKGNHPNWFWRWMQYLCFGNRWVKKDRGYNGW